MAGTHVATAQAAFAVAARGVTVGLNSSARKPNPPSQLADSAIATPRTEGRLG